MNILIVGPAMGLPIPCKNWGGIERVVYRHACELRKLGHSVDILNDRGPAKLQYFDNWKDYDVIHVHQEWCFDELKSRGANFIFTSHMSSWQRNWVTVGKLLRNCTMAMPFELMGDKLEDEGFDGFWSIWNGADDALFKPGEKEPGLCLAVGKDEARKKFADVIAQVQGSSEFKKLILVGPGNEKYAAENKVEVMPNLPEEEIAALMGKAEYFFHLAEEEADCLVVKEAAMSGCKLIVSDYCAKTLFASKAELLNGEFCRRLALQDFTWEKVVHELEEGYKFYMRKVSACLPISV